MTSITIRDVSEETRNELAKRAARQGRSLQEYLRRELDDLAGQPDPDEWMDRVRARVRRSGTTVTAEQILADRDSGRR
ncbi:hypothetical protein FOE78_22295 [Microlunatus elymi]|uniref:Antitoxin FitA-like ribbon-helix-helix domain-containing protein n=1 Tax=Microlunatus elymi TaxID=2596828 RepID=A0A516Q4H2_9ACTN|nr:hypothetical protein [Microlunatus elymi]QDP98272.1 hypothetical protein FOE78_22295 [Microlunatus elymi]